MEALKIISCFSISFLFHFGSVFLGSAAEYTIPERYFINCGSASNVSIDGHIFIGDAVPVKSVSAPSSSSTRKDQNSSAPELYRTARLFTRTSSYGFDIDGDGIYVVRFHFFPLTSLGKLSDARFRVLASGISLLSNFTVGNRNYSSSPPTEEFLLKIPGQRLQIDFVPQTEGLFAFVNAIEVFLAPPELFPASDTTIPRATPERESTTYNGLRNNIIRVIHRINVGGENIMPNNDTLLRYWIPDDGFIINKNAANNIEPYSGQLHFQIDGSSPYIAPEYVYRTAKKMEIRDDGLTSKFNVSWRFGVQRGAEHLLRLHFCDVVTTTTNELVRFNLYIYSNFATEMWPYGHQSQPESPFYVDYLVKSDDSGFMNISIGPSNRSEDPTAAPFLNGVEIMELIGNTSGWRAGGAGHSRRNQMFFIVGSSFGGGIIVFAFVILASCFFVLRKKKGKSVETDWGSVPMQGSLHSRISVKTASSSKLTDHLHLGLKFRFSDILHATKNFSPNLMIGRGGFGRVYKGTLRDGTKVAVKRSEPEHGQGLSEFETEIKILSKIHHHHLVSLIGYCDDGNEMILVYEFMENGTLREHLYTSEGREPGKSNLSWEERLRICIDAARGLVYLHTGCSSTIIHRDIKSTNILLDENYVAKVADFGLSRLGRVDESHVTEIKGTFGYLDPECIKYFPVTLKSDVYAFGVVLLEVVCARPAVLRGLGLEEDSLVLWGLSWIRKGQLDKIIDPLLVGKVNPKCLRKFGDTVEKCLQECGEDRPNMSDVLWDLEYCLKLQRSTAAWCEETTPTDVVMGLPLPVLEKLSSDIMGEDELRKDSHVERWVDVGEAPLLNSGEAS